MSTIRSIIIIKGGLHELERKPAAFDVLSSPLLVLSGLLQDHGGEFVFFLDEIRAF